MVTRDSTAYAFTAGPGETGQRLDRAIVAMLPELTRGHAQDLIGRGLVTVDGVTAKASHRLRAGTVVSVVVPPTATVDLRPEPLPLTIVYEDEAVIVLDKPAGLVVHPALGHPSGTLVNAVLAHAPGVVLNGTQRPGIVHRLDKDTSGLMVVTKTDAARLALVEQFASRQVYKEYLALVHGYPPPSVTIDAPIGRDPRQRQRMAVVPDGRSARTDVASLEALPSCTLVRAQPLTGRTHQIRVHLAALGHPIAGDSVYGRPGPLVVPASGRHPPRHLAIPRQFLHAARLGFRLPASGAWREFASPLPNDLAAVLASLRTTL